MVNNAKNGPRNRHIDTPVHRRTTPTLDWGLIISVVIPIMRWGHGAILRTLIHAGNIVMLVNQNPPVIRVSKTDKTTKQEEREGKCLFLRPPESSIFLLINDADKHYPSSNQAILCNTSNQGVLLQPLSLDFC